MSFFTSSKISRNSSIERVLSYGGQVVAALLAMTLLDPVAGPQSRGASRSRFCKIIRPIRKRAQGMPGARCTRGVVCKRCTKKRTRAYRYRRSNPAFPAQWFYGLFRALPGDEFVLSPSSQAGVNVACYIFRNRARFLEGRAWDGIRNKNRSASRHRKYPNTRRARANRAFGYRQRAI
jgi:hypothetical protein